MFLFGSTSPFDAEVEKATNEKNTVEDWARIMDVCDSVGNSSVKAKDCLRSIVKRLNHTDPHVVMQAISLLDACSSNCGKPFLLEIASREFEGELKKLLGHSQPKLVDKAKALIKKWSEGDFKTDPQLNLIPSLYAKLKQDGIDFSSIIEPHKHACSTASANASREEADLAKAIELSLKENKNQESHNSPKNTSLYPSVNASMTSNIFEKRKVRALYDFEAAEDNELSFAAGDIIHILDDSDANWWKGVRGKMEGLFPVNFVTADLSVEPDHITKLEQGNKKSVQFVEEVEVKTLKREPEIIEVEIDEGKIDRLLHLLHEADPQSDTSDPSELLDLEEQVMAMGPLIDAALEKVDRRHAQLTQLSADLVDALNLYHTLQREPPPPTPTYTYGKMPHHSVYPYPNQPPHMFNGIPGHHPFPGNFNPNISMPPSDYMPPGSMSIPQHYHLPPGHAQHPSGHPGPHGHHPPSQGPPHHPQGMPPGNLTSQAPEQTSLPYQQPGFPPQGVPQQYVPPGAQGPPQQPQYPPPNGQHMM
ncbi:signal transducing adapter molecule 1 isoform X1 [Diachasmimorpha longicaudata]|uniref:signal transducing adapter molecule 1 isoform X1 n=1 Tax=Diachasmimorpha longicaudata TaxID=58733 RepID=UPI0030B8BB4B